MLHLKEKLKLDAHGMQVGKSKVFLKDSGTHSSRLRGMGVDTPRTCFRMTALMQIQWSLKGQCTRKTDNLMQDPHAWPSEG